MIGWNARFVDVHRHGSLLHRNGANRRWKAGNVITLVAYNALQCRGTKSVDELSGEPGDSQEKDPYVANVILVLPHKDRRQHLTDYAGTGLTPCAIHQPLSREY